MKDKKKASAPAAVDTTASVELLLDEMASMKRRMDSVEEIVGCRADADDNLRAKYIAKFKSSRRRVQVYLALDGVRDVNAVARTTNIIRQNVDVEIRALKRARLIDIADSNGRGTIYRKKNIDRIIGLSDDLMEAFSVDQDGRLVK